MVAHDPQQRRDIARKAAAKRHSIDTAVKQVVDHADELTSAHIDSIVAAAPKMTSQQADRLRALFAPLVKAARTEGGPG